jgi:hypothetical protein
MGASKQKTETELPEFQQEFLEETVIPAAKDIFATPFTPYEGNRVAGLDPRYGEATDIYRGFRDENAYSPDVFGSRVEANLANLGTNVDPYLAAQQRQFDIAGTQQEADLVRSGAFGNVRRGLVEAEQAAAENIAREQMVEDIRQQDLNRAMGLTQQQIASEQALAGQAAGGLTQLGQVGTLQGQLALDAPYEEFLRGINYPMQAFGVLPMAAGTIPGGLGTSTQISRPGFGSYLSGGASLAGALFGASDVRLKSNIERTGNHKGVNYYRWTWNGEAKRIGVDSHPTSGVMAHELASTHPHLVVAGEDGYLRVNYDGLHREQMESA